MLVTETVLVDDDPGRPLVVTVLGYSPLSVTDVVTLPSFELREYAVLPPTEALDRIAPYERERLRRAIAAY